jgi:hypothetical protein
MKFILVRTLLAVFVIEMFKFGHLVIFKKGSDPQCKLQVLHHLHKFTIKSGTLYHIPITQIKLQHRIPYIIKHITEDIYLNLAL